MRCGIGTALAAALCLVFLNIACTAITTAPQAKRSVQTIIDEINATGDAMGDVTFASLINPERRAELAPKIGPPLKKLVALCDELIAGDQADLRDQARSVKTRSLAQLVVMGDAEAKTKLEQQAASRDRDDALYAKTALLLGNWMLAHKDPAAQEKLVPDAAALARDNPQDEMITQRLYVMMRTGAASPALAEKIEKIITSMKSESAQQVAETLEVRHQLLKLENKPIEIRGPKLGGGDFSTNQWKGHVVLVDFWATWCPPCRAAMPGLKKTYAKWHDKGLEVIGVNNDPSVDQLNKFLKVNPDMPWPQLFDPNARDDLNPIATKFGVKLLPTMFLIDKSGVLRSVDPDDDLEELIPKLLGEKAG